MRPAPASTAARRFFRNPDTGELVIVQRPNLPLWLFIAATAVRQLLRPHGSLGTTLSVVGALSLAVWAVLEVARGDSPFRRVLGGVVLVGMVLGQLLR